MPASLATVAFTYRNPVDFSYPYFDGTLERTITELRDPAIIREGDGYYLTWRLYRALAYSIRSGEQPGPAAGMGP